MNGGWFFTVAFSQLLCFPFLSPYTTSPPKEFLTTVFHCSRADPETHAFSQSSLLTFRESVNIFQNDSPTPAEIPKGPRKRIQGDRERAGNSTSRSSPRLPAPPFPRTNWSIVSTADCRPAEAPVGRKLHGKPLSPLRLRSCFCSA